MSSGPEHYRKAEEILAELAEVMERAESENLGLSPEAIQAVSTRALAYATLAQAAATIADTFVIDLTKWTEAIK